MQKFKLAPATGRSQKARFQVRLVSRRKTPLYVSVHQFIFDKQKLLLEARIGKIFGLQACLVRFGKIAENVIGHLLVGVGFSHLFCLLLIVAEKVILSLFAAEFLSA